MSELAFGHAPRQGGLVARKFQLDNGLGVILLRDTSAPVIAYQTWFRVGSRHEREGRTGIAHLFEHLMFNQTKSLPPGEFDRLIEAAGGETNAGTWVDWTYYMDNAPKAALPRLIDLEAERMQHLTLGEVQVESEREVVANERRQRVDDLVEGFLSEELYKLAFEIHPYHWPTIGWMADIHAITIDDCRAFYRTYYAPNNAVLVVVGDFDEVETLAHIERVYGAIPRQPITSEKIDPEPSQRAPRRREWKKTVPADRLQIGWRATGQGEPDFAVLELIAELLAGGNASRLYRELVVNKELATLVQGSVAPFRDPGLLEITVSLTRGHAAEEAERAVYDHVQKLATEGPSEAELAGARARLLTRFWTALRPQTGKAEGLGHAEITLGDYRKLFDAPRQYDEIDAAAVRRVAATYLSVARSNVVVARPLPGGDTDSLD
jgi:zinc protease